MPLQENLNVAPYYADYNPLSDYYSILFKAGFPIQARELTNMQLMQQNQIESFMNKFMKAGDTVVPGEYFYSLSAYARVSSITQGATPEEFIGYTLTGAVSGVKGVVQHATAETTTDDITFYISYESSGKTKKNKKFKEGETLESDTPNRYTAVAGVTGVSKPLSVPVLGEDQECPAMGIGSLFTVESGSYYVDGISVRNDKQIITLDKYSTLPTYQVGFNVSEQFISSNDDSALLDNSQGSSNFAAPGADRLKITLTLSKTTVLEPRTNFIEICNLTQGNIIKEPSKSRNWAWLYEILAKRTNDESGSYILTDFPVELLQYWNETDVNGLFNADVDDLYPAVPGSGETEKLTLTQADERYVLKMSPGEAYVQGFNVEIKRPIYIYGNKPRTQNFRPNSLTTITTPFDVKLTNLYNIPDFANITSSVDTVAFDGITIYRNFIDGYVGEAVSDGKPYNIGLAPPVTYHVMTASDIGTINESGIGGVVYKGTRGAVVQVDSNTIVARYNGTPLTSGSVINQVGGANVLISIRVNPSPAGVIYPRYLMPKNIIDDLVNENDANNVMAVAGYNSTYDMGIIKSDFFNEFAIIEDQGTRQNNADWSVGNLVEGERTGTFGTVEAGSTLDMLILSNIIGEFESGEFITQKLSNGSKKIGRIAKAGDTLRFEFPDANIPDLSVVTSIVVSALGSSITLGINKFEHDSVTNSLIPTIAGRIKLREFPYPEGSALQKSRIKLKATITTGATTAVGYAVTIPSNTENSLSKTKSFFSALSDTPNFSANMAIENNLDTDIYPVASRSLFRGTAGDNRLICKTFSGDPSTELIFGDLITFSDNLGVQRSHLCYFSTEPVGYGTDKLKATIYLTTPLENDVTGAIVERIRIKTKGQPENNLLFQLPQKVVSSLQSNPDATGINYYVLQEFVLSVSAGATTIVLETNAANEFFIQGSRDVVVAIAKAGGEATSPKAEDGRQLTVFSSSVTDSNRKITLTISDEANPTPIRRNSKVKVILPVYVTNAKAKSKKLTSFKTLTVSAADAAKAVISLGVADGVLVESMIMEPNDIDVRDNYTFDTGQRDNFYGISTLSLREGRPPASGALTIRYKFFKHSGSGDFFSVDSYTSDAGVSYAQIPIYAPIAGIPINMQSDALYVQLRDCVDFRPIVNTTGSTPSYLPSITDNEPTLGSINFRNTSNDGDGTSPRIPLLGSNFECNLAFYQPKIDSLFIEKSGAVTLVEGVPAEEPVAPADIATGIRLYDIKLPPYVFNMGDVGVQKYNYKGYKMKDIVSLERRIGRLEELVSLSLLEQSALNMSVRDAVTGLDRFKNGMVVDSFVDHGQGATGSRNYRCSIDPEQTHMRAPFYADQIELIESGQNETIRNANGYTKQGPQLMLNFSNRGWLSNPFATRSMNLQPYSVFAYDGDVKLFPAIDTWQDDTVRPDLVIRDNSLFDSMVNITEEMAEAGFGTVWGEWQNTGRTRTNVNRTTTDAANTRDTTEELNSPPIRVTTTTRSVQLARQQTTTNVAVQTGRVQETSYGQRVTDVSLARTMRSRSVRVNATKLKPNTEYYIFFDDVDCTEWFAVDKIQSESDDDSVIESPADRYREIAGTNSLGFGYPILSDDIGTLRGVFIIPNGRPPVQEQKFRDFNRINYQTSGPTRSFKTGTRKFRITSSSIDNQDKEILEGFAETTYVASGVLLDKQGTVVSTTIPEFSSSTSTTATENRWDVNGVDVSARNIGPPTIPEPTVINNITNITNIRQDITNVTNVTQNINRVVPNPQDPLAQTFMVDGNEFPDGVFATELGVFFETKDPVEGCEVYLTTTDGQVPTTTIVPFSRITKNSETTLRVKCRLGSGVTSTTLQRGITVIGQTSGATGVLKSGRKFNSSSQNNNKNVSNTTYNLTLSNYVGTFVAGEIIVPSVTPAETSKFTIVDDQIEIDYVEVTDVGRNYSTDAVVTFSSPQLPGGVTATGTVKVGIVGSSGAGMVYEVELTEAGSGYTKPPSATISGSVGSGAVVSVRTSEGREAVDMGVCTSEDASAETIFKFRSPVYLLGDSTYAFVVKSATSVKYRAYTAKMGENMIGTNNRVIHQASLGALFKSQNGGLWTEDQTTNMKFALRRARFDKDTTARIDLINSPIGRRSSPRNPITTNTRVKPDGDETRFGSNPKVVRVNCKWHGLLSGDLVAISGVVGNPGGIPSAEFNTLHTVISAGMNNFTILMNTSATSEEAAGGTRVFVTPNREYESVNVTTGAMVFGPTSIFATTTPTIGLSSSQSLRADTDTDGGALTLARNRYTKGNGYVIDLLETYYYSGVKTVLNQINEAKYNGSDRLDGHKSLEVSVNLQSVSNAVSPVINLQRTNATVIRNLVDNPKPTDPIYGVPIATLVMNSDSSGLTGVIAGSNLSFTNHSGVTRTVYVDSHDTETDRIVVRGEHVNELLKTHTFSDSAVAAIGTSSIIVKDGELYYSDVSERGSSWAKYISKMFIFENENDGIQLKLSACYYTKDSIRCYYRSRSVGFDGDVSQINWTPFNPDQELNATIVDSDQQNILVDAKQVVPGLPDDVNKIIVRDSDNVDPNEILPDGWKSLVWTAQDLPKFDALAIKIVMVVDNPALTPIIDDMQLVVSE